jgi:hypothetical protein
MTDDPSSDASGPDRPSADAADETGAPAVDDDPDTAVGAVAGDDTATEETADTADDEGGPGRDVPEEAGDREVVVPLRVYKTVTVFSTLLAVAAVVGGFLLIDRATNRATAASVDPVFGVGGIALIVAGAGIYAFSTRFRAEGMGKSKDDAAEDSGNG